MSKKTKPIEMKCCICGTTDEKKFHPNSIIGFGIALSMEQLKVPWDYKTKEWKCLECFRKKRSK